MGGESNPANLRTAMSGVFNAPCVGRQSGQAAVEAAITLPMVLFLLLGTLQLFLMMNARIQAQYAVFRAVRVGVVNHADCRPMADAALAALLPSIARADDPVRVAHGFRARGPGAGYRYAPAEDAGHDRAIFWLDRQAPAFTGQEDVHFDQWDVGPEPRRLDARLVYWYALRIPFANWVMSRMFLGWFGIQRADGANPLLPVQAETTGGWLGPASLESELADELRRRVRMAQYSFPIVVNASMRMMSPLRKPFAQRCGVTG
jgi:hypothetical protein